MIKNVIYTFLLLAFSTTAFAHPGHDHSHWMSGAIHFLLAGACLSVAALGVYSLKAKVRTSKAKVKK